MELRPYQRAAIEATYAYWQAEGGNPLIEMATGTGKSAVIAALIQELMENYPALRVVVLVHVRELVSQDAQQILRFWPGAPLGINSAGLGRRDFRHPILCASIQSVHRYAHAMGKRDLVIVDEAHLVPKHGDGMYNDLLGEMWQINPDMRVFGCTATPYRLDSGRLDRGDGRLFHRICYTYGIGEGIRDGYLAPLTSKRGATEIDVAGVARRGGEFVPEAVAAAADQAGITSAAVDEIVRLGANRRSWLIFATSVDHAHHVKDEIAARGVPCAVVSAKTPKDERDRILNAFKAGRLRCITNVQVLTTGFDAPNVDLIALLRPTLSTGLFVQMIGRGTRVAPGKQDCLILDYSGNVRRHGHVDDVAVPQTRNQKTREESAEKDIVAVAVNDVRAQLCLACQSYNSMTATRCQACGAELKGALKHAAVAEEVQILSGRASPTDWRLVTDVHFYRHDKKISGKLPSMRVTYGCGVHPFNEWVCFQHEAGSVPRRKAEHWWRERHGAEPIPATVTEALARTDELEKVEAIRVFKDGAYDRVVNVKIVPRQLNLLDRKAG